MMSADHKRFLQTFREAFSQAVLTESPESGDGARVFRLRRPGQGGVGGVDLAFVSAEFKRTIITTDYGLGINGVVSVRGIGPTELVEAASSPQLAAWFLELRWYRDRAHDDLEALVARCEGLGRHRTAEDLRAVLLDFEESPCGEDSIRASVLAAGVDESDVPGYGYDPRDQALLQAIAEQFAEALPERG